MANPTVKRAAKVCRRAACGRLFRPSSGNYKRQQYCGRLCSVADRSRLSRVLAGRKGGEAKAKRRTGPELLQNVKAAAYRRGFSDGYEQAMRDTNPAYAAACDAADAAERRLAHRAECKAVRVNARRSAARALRVAA